MKSLKSFAVLTWAALMGINALAGSVTFNIIPAGLFQDKPASLLDVSAVRVVYGLINEPVRLDEKGEWEIDRNWIDRQESPISYLDGYNVKTDINMKSNGLKNRVFVFKLIYERAPIYFPYGFSEFPKENLDSPGTARMNLANSPAWVINPAQPKGGLMELPISNVAGFPFSCLYVGFDRYTSELKDSPGYQGRILSIYYGYTPYTLNQYLANNDVPWFNAMGKPEKVGILTPSFNHDGGYKGVVQMHKQYVWVPYDSNLVFKLQIEKKPDLCDSKSNGFKNGINDRSEYTPTQTYFVNTTSRQQ